MRRISSFVVTYNDGSRIEVDDKDLDYLELALSVLQVWKRDKKNLHRPSEDQKEKWLQENSETVLLKKLRWPRSKKSS